MNMTRAEAREEAVLARHCFALKRDLGERFQEEPPCSVCGYRRWVWDWDYGDRRVPIPCWNCNENDEGPY